MPAKGVTTPIHTPRLPGKSTVTRKVAKARLTTKPLHVSTKEEIFPISNADLDAYSEQMNKKLSARRKDAAETAETSPTTTAAKGFKEHPLVKSTIGRFIRSD